MFEGLPAARADALMVVAQRFRADPRPDKLDLGVGVYRHADGTSSVLKVVKRAESQLVEEQLSKAYLPADGDAEFVRLMVANVLGAETRLISESRIAAAQCPGGTGALHQALAILKKAGRNPTVWVGTPTWPNHIPLARHHGFAVETYDYFDIASQSLQFDHMMSALGRAKAGDVALLHGVCHNPTGADLSHAQWEELVALIRDRALIPLIDFAYHGFGVDRDQDAAGVRLMVQHVPEMLVAASCSKSFGLYRERTGLLMAVCSNAADAGVVQGSLQTLARLNYSNPPDHGGAIVRTILSDAELTQSWIEELAEMRERVVSVRHQLKAEGRKQSFDLDFVSSQMGLFTTFDLTEKQTDTMARDHAIHMPGTGRINLSGLGEQKIPHFVAALKAAS